MHPILKDRARLGTYLLGWVPVALLLLVAGRTLGWTWLGSTLVALPLAILGSGLFLTSWHLCRAFPLERTQGRGRWPAWLMAALVLGNLWAGCGWLIAWGLGRFPDLKVDPRAWSTPWAFFASMGTLLYLGSLALHYVLAALEQRRTSERTEQELRVLAREAELKALRAQLNPHFLFNSLNSVSSLTVTNPLKARDMIVKLSDFMRYSLSSRNEQPVTLGNEMESLRLYLQIEKVRFGERLSIEEDISPECLPALMPGMLLQPLYENAVKHGVYESTEEVTIRTTVRKQNEMVIITVTNNVDTDSVVTRKGAGIGLKNVSSRLELFFGDKADLTVNHGDDSFTVIVRFPFRKS